MKYCKNCTHFKPDFWHSSRLNCTVEVKGETVKTTDPITGIVTSETKITNIYQLCEQKNPEKYKKILPPWFTSWVLTFTPFYEVLNENNDCIHYKQKWWKFWI